MQPGLMVVGWGLWAAATVVAIAHVIVRKTHTRSAIGWIGLILAWPLLGIALYWLFGINRVERRAARLLAPGKAVLPQLTDAQPAEPGTVGHLSCLAELVDRVVGLPLLSGCAVSPLDGGPRAYAAMREAIASARRSVAMVSYIFDDDEVGRAFVADLAAAVQRGVEVRVLVDGLGALYSMPTISRRLRAAGVPNAKFLWSWLPWRTAYLNLRNHRKVLVCDGTVAFTGGMNIRAGYLMQGPPSRHVHDLHFRVEGPVVRQLTALFVTDWAFATGEVLEGEAWFPALAPAGPAMARMVPDGPDEDINKIRLTLMGALASARERVQIVTPYFLPDPALRAALETTALRGCRVDLLLPLKSNLPYMAWATTYRLPSLLRRGVRVWLTAPPFDHTKVCVVDGRWTLIGSANWDERSLRLNFEVDVEVYCEQLAAACSALVDRRLETAERLTLEAVMARSLPVRLRDGAARLLEPYL